MLRKILPAITAASALVIAGVAPAQSTGDGAGGIWANHKNAKSASTKNTKKNGAKTEEPANTATSDKPNADASTAPPAASPPAKDAADGKNEQAKPAECVASADHPCQ